jgi:hypothetical protein
LLAASHEARSVVVPVTAIARRGQLESVFVVERGVARLRLVRTGRERDGAIEVVSGLSDGESVVSADVGTLLDDQPVQAIQ